MLELVSLLTSMSSSVIFDNVCFLVMDSAHEFYSWLKHMIEGCEDNEEEQQYFLSKWEQPIPGVFHRGNQLSMNFINSMIIASHSANCHSKRRLNRE